MESFRRDHSCERARAWVSLEVDGELSHVERVLLAAHVRRCAPCRRAVADVRAATALLRTAPLERPETIFVPPARKPRPFTRGMLGFRIAASTSLAALAAGLGVLVGTVDRAPTDREQASPPDVAFNVNTEPKLRGQAHRPEKERLFPPGRQGGV